MIKWIKSLFHKNKVMSTFAPNITVINNQQQFDSERDRYEQQLRYQYELEQLRLKYAVTVNTDKKTVQYSKKAVTVIIIFTLFINFFYFCVLIPMSGRWGITDSAFQYPSTVLEVWDSGTVLFLMAYFAKSIFESKWESDAKLKSKELDKLNVPKQVENVVKDVIDKVSNNNNSDAAG